MLEVTNTTVADARRRRLPRRLGVLLASLGLWTLASAGGSAETTLLVVNAASPLSQYVANEYLRLRDIPATHLLRLDGVPSIGTLGIDEFRRKIWQPIQDYLVEHGLEQEIDLVVYSADFPYGVDFSSDVKAHQLPRNRYRGQVASLTGLTYFARRVAAGDVGYLGVNHYFREFVAPARRPTASSVAAARLDKQALKSLRKEAQAALRQKDYALATERYRQLVDHESAKVEHWLNLARAQAAAGDAEQALASLTEAVERGWVNSVRLRRDRELAGLQGHPGFEALLQRLDSAYGPFEIAHGFRHRYVWSNVDLAFWEPDDALNQYYLSTVLAYTGVRGNSLPEIGNYLSRAAASDGTAPEGTVYLLENGDVRSETRQPLFPATVAELARRGRKAEILGRGDPGQKGIIPMRRDDVIGAVVGTQSFNWEKSQSRLLPGAVAESLTSYGGHFDKATQTKLTAFLRHGAAGSSGAVAEPFAFQEKFPVPLLHAYYADGCSLAEAYYQSVQAPYQLIIVGDPLARPFARFARVGLQSPDPAQAWSGIVEITPFLQPAEGTALKNVELWVDGQYLTSAPVGQVLSWDTRTVEDGGHELRLVAVEDSPIETRSVHRATIMVFNRERRLAIEPFAADLAYTAALELSGQAPGAERLELRRGHQLLDAAIPQGDRWRLVVPVRALGMGEAAVQVRALYADGGAVRSAPLPLRIREPALLPAIAGAPPEGEGLLALVHDGQGEVRQLSVDKLHGRLKGLEGDGVQPVTIQLHGYLKIEQPGLYQLAVRSQGRVRLSLHDQALLDDRLSTQDAEAFVALGLESGWHPLQIELEPGAGKPLLQVVLAGQTPPVMLSAQQLGHRAQAPGD